jgi:CO dehydrogenase maturation factor
MGKAIAIAGKGGTGKSTIAALLVAELCARRQGPVLAIDADPDANLGTLLGIEPRQTVGNLRDEVLKEIKNFPAGMSKASYVEAGLHQIIEEEEGFDLITMGKGEGPGCYCYLNSLIRKFSDDLMPGYAWVVIDNEAGLEHISRRTSGRIDGLIIVVNDNPISVKTARSICEAVDALHNEVRQKFVVTNMVHPQHRAAILAQVAQLPVAHLCDIPPDPDLEEAIFRGEPLRKLKRTSAHEKIQLIIDAIGGQA